MWFKQTNINEGERMGHQSRSAAPSILSVDLKIEGDIVSEGEVHISGAVKGDVVARKLTLGEGGSITGAVEADVAMIAGSLAGRLTATTVLLARTARVVADVTHVSLTIEPGAVFEGFSRRVESIETITDDTIRTQPPRLTPPRGENRVGKESKES
jgi:cytoskeletal protein CcmA (bactofilin family)